MWKREPFTSRKKEVAVQDAVEFMQNNVNALEQQISSVTYDVENKVFVAEVSYLVM